MPLGILLGCDDSAVPQRRRCGGVVLHADDRHVTAAADVQCNDPLRRIVYLRQTLNGIVQRIAQQGVNVVVLHILQTAAVCRADQLNPCLPAECRLLGQCDVQRLIPGEIAQVQVVHLFFQTGAFLIRGAGILLFQVMVADVDFFHVFFCLLILLLVTFQQLRQHFIFVFQTLDAAI